MSPTARRTEGGFSLIEILVVVAILMVLIALGIAGIQSARSSGQRAAAVATARAYEQAIDRFAAAHGGRVPQANATDWPNATAAAGPITNIMGQKKFYLPRTPESVVDGRILVRVGTPPAATRTSITYMIDGGGYRLEVRVPGRPPCALYGQGGKQSGSEPASCG